MKSHLFLVILFAFTLTSMASGETYKARCQIENARTHTMAQKVVELEFINNGQFAQKKISVSSTIGNMGKVSLSGQFTVAVLGNEPRLTIMTDLKIPQHKMSSADVQERKLDDSRGDVLNAGSMLFLDKDVINYGCVLTVN
jgi:hypothetical protein